MPKPIISANSLFHFTPSIDNLISIVQNGFYPHYCLESFQMITGDDTELAIPMVCFCDIPLSKIETHTEYYGKYAIALEKSWGIKNSISPVMYAYKDSASSKHLGRLFNKIIDGGLRYLLKDISESQLNSYFDVIAYLKSYKGKLYRKGKYLDESIEFYDEKEWRYIAPVPARINKKDVKLIKVLIKDSFVDDNIITELNKKLQTYRIEFSVSDVKYIIIENEEKILTMIKKINGLQKKFISDNDKSLFISKIISLEKILQDF